MNTDRNVTVTLTSVRHDECSMCTLRRDIPLWRVESTSPSRRIVMIYCDICMNDLMLALKEQQPN